MNFRIVSRFLGILFFILSLSMFTSLIPALFYGENETVINFSISTLIGLLLGIAFFVWGKKAGVTINRRDALAVVAIGWIGFGVVGAIPFMLEEVLTNPIDAFFETVSGFTTTGSTVITDLDKVSYGLLYWRSLTQWLGGMGIIVLFIAVLPQLGIGVRQMFRSEVPGPITEGLKPKLKETASILWKIYLGITLAEILLLWAAGMSIFDAVCHSLTTMATGGYSTRDESIAYYSNPLIQIIIIVFMLAAGVNFGLYYQVAKGKWKMPFKNSEFRVYIGLLLAAGLVLSVSIMHLHTNFFDAVRHGFFQSVSIGTTTGYATDDFDIYPPFAKVLLVVLMFIGGSAGSTGGGMKVSRIMVLVKAAYHEVYHTFRPQVVVSLKVGKNVISESVVKSISAFFIIFILIFVLGTLFLTALGLDMVTAFSATIAALGNIGPGLAKVGATQHYAHVPYAGKLFLAIAMILGRLELFTILVLFSPKFWKS
ncbi:MAG: TrkH family potassium uptake protein [candidate division Zixibacteria bacterium]|nr:TrkH family potassium uptake protein [candidate division Zixibacteria bacterium]